MAWNDLSLPSVWAGELGMFPKSFGISAGAVDDRRRPSTRMGFQRDGAVNSLDRVLGVSSNQVRGMLARGVLIQLTEPQVVIHRAILGSIERMPGAPRSLRGKPSDESTTEQ